MKRNLRFMLILISVLLITSLVAAQCGGAAPTEAPKAEEKPTEAPKAEEKPTEAPKVEEKPTEAPKAEEKPTEAPKAEEKPTEAATSSSSETSMSGLPEVDPLSVTGDIISAGSSTVYPLSERMAERFKDEGYTGNITIDSIGSGAGLERFCVSGESDIANSSRAIKDSEIASCASIGRTPVEFQVGIDALAVVVNPKNAFLKDLTVEQLATIFSTAEKWSDVDPAWPAQPIQRFIPGTDSGTFDYFVEHVFNKDKEPILKAKNTQLSEDDNVLVQGIEGSEFAIGFFGYAYFEENASKLSALSIEGIAPSEQTAQDGSYPLARPLFLYSDAKIMKEKPQVAAFINFYLTHVNEEILEVGYFPASDNTLNLAKSAWSTAVTGQAMTSASSSEAATDSTMPEVDPLSVTGDIISAGSSTVYPLSERMAERFKDEGYTGNITIDSIGSGAGLERFCVSGESDIANSSRAIKDSEIASCASIGRTPVEFQVGIDALAVVVNPKNAFLKDVTVEQLATIFSTAEKWSDVDPAWPAQPIQRFIPGTDSGTFDYFVEHVFNKDKEPILKAKNTQLSEDDNVLVQGIEGSEFAIGFFGYAYFEENASKLSALSIEGIAPSEQTAQDGSYPLARPLFLYSDAKIMKEKPQVAAFINFYLTHVNEEILEVGYFPASDNTLNLAKSAWSTAVK